jgi:hypothetical protein
VPYFPMANRGPSVVRGQRVDYRSMARGSDLPDPFAEQPVRRSAGLVAVSSLIVFAPILVDGPLGTTILLSGGWLGLTGLVMGIPILAWSLLEEGWCILQRRLHPPVESLDLSPRVAHVLRRHGYDAIRDVDLASDDALMCLSNMDARGLREIRRAIGLWKYQRWQERGFPMPGPG